MSWFRQLMEQGVAEQRAHHRRVEQSLAEFEQRLIHLEQIAMTDQDTLNAEAAKLDTISNNLNTLVTTTIDLKAEVDALKNAASSGAPLDFSALDSKINHLDSVLTNINGTITDPGPQ